jgi:predicted permease
MHGWPYEDLNISAWVLLPISFGLLLSRWGVQKRAARGLFAFSFYGCQTAVTACAIWVARIQAAARLLPLLALTGWLVTALLAWLVSRRLERPPPQRGAFILSMAMSNNGFTLLGFVALAAFGEAGLAQATYAQLFYAPFFLLCCFPIARAFSRGAAPRALGKTLLENTRDPRVWLPLLAISIGLGLNVGHVARPAFVSQLTRGLIFVGTAASSCAIGLIFNGFHLKRYWRENLLSLVYRCTLYPLLYWVLARSVGLSPLDTRILVLYGLVPSALLANMLAVFFDLDSELTSSVFMVSTISFLVFVLPVYLLSA